ELFGHVGVEGDIEIQQLMVKALQAAGIESLLVDYSHVGIFGSLISLGGVSKAKEKELYAALQSKDRAAVQELAAALDAKVRDAFCDLCELNGDASILDKAAQLLPETPAIAEALQELRQVNAAL